MKAVVDDIEVIVGKNGFIKTDTDIAAEVVRALKESWTMPKDKIKVIVDNGWVTLEGTPQWDFQREAALKAVRYLDGVRGVFNKMKIKAEVHNELEKKRGEDALRRNWAIEADKIHVKADGNTITLSGIVKSVYEKEEAEKIAWKTPGV